LATAQATTAPAPEQNALRALAADLPRWWDSPTTSHRDRKRLLRSLIADITLLPAIDDDSVRIGVRWHTGATDELTALRHPGRTPAGALELVRRYGATHTNEQLAERLNAAGLLTGKGNPSPPARSPASETPTKSGRRAPWPSKTARSASNTPPHSSVFPPAPSTTGWSKDRFRPAAPRADGGASPGNPATQKIYRDKVAKSFRLKPTNLAANRDTESDATHRDNYGR
jgi:hypothetical protein